MRIFHHVKKIFLFLALLQIFLGGCAKKEAPVQQKTSVLVSIAPYIYFIDKISQHTIKAETLTPLGANPHMFEPSPKQMQPLYQADIWFSTGEPFEHKMAKLLKEYNPSLTAVDLTEGIDLLPAEGHCQGHSHGGEEGKDRHIWLSPSLASVQAQVIAKALIQRYPEKKEIFLSGLRECLHDLESVDVEIRKALAPLEGKTIVTSHPAFAYFCRDYKLRQLSVEHEGKDPLPKQTASLIQTARKLHVKSVLLQTQYNNKGAEQIAKELDLPVHFIDPYSSNYVDNLRNLAYLLAHE